MQKSSVQKFTFKPKLPNKGNQMEETWQEVQQQ